MDFLHSMKFKTLVEERIIKTVFEKYKDNIYFQSCNITPLMLDCIFAENYKDDPDKYFLDIANIIKEIKDEPRTDMNKRNINSSTKNSTLERNKELISNTFKKYWKLTYQYLENDYNLHINKTNNVLEEILNSPKIPKYFLLYIFGCSIRNNVDHDLLSSTLFENQYYDNLLSSLNFIIKTEDQEEFLRPIISSNNSYNSDFNLFTMFDVDNFKKLMEFEFGNIMENSKTFVTINKTDAVNKIKEVLRTNRHIKDINFKMSYDIVFYEFKTEDRFFQLYLQYIINIFILYNMIPRKLARIRSFVDLINQIFTCYLFLTHFKDMNVILYNYSILLYSNSSQEISDNLNKIKSSNIFDFHDFNYKRYFNDYIYVGDIGIKIDERLIDNKRSYDYINISHIEKNELGVKVHYKNNAISIILSKKQKFKCVICFSHTMKISNCGHVICARCIYHIKRDICPTCKYPLRPIINLISPGKNLSRQLK